MALPIDLIPIGEGLTALGKEGATFYFLRRELLKIEETGPVSKYQDGQFVEEVVRHPCAIFEGLQRHGHRDCLCYSGKVSVMPGDPPPAGLVFLVYVREGESGRAFFVLDWAWREEDPDQPGHPLKSGDDFTRLTWCRR